MHVDAEAVFKPAHVVQQPDNKILMEFHPEDVPTEEKRKPPSRIGERSPPSEEQLIGPKGLAPGSKRGLWEDLISFILKSAEHRTAVAFRSFQNKRVLLLND